MINNKFFITGWNHSGTTIVQHTISKQLGISTEGRLKESLPNLNDSSKYVWKYPGEIKQRTYKYLKKLLLDPKQPLHVVFVIRDSNDLISSVIKREIMFKKNEEEIVSNLFSQYTFFLKFITEEFIKNYDNYSVVKLEDFACNPNFFLEKLNLNNYAVETKNVNISERPKDIDHKNLRIWQSKQPIDKNIIQHSNIKYKESIEIEKYQNKLLEEYSKKNL